MTKGKINVTTENIFPIIKKFLYSDHEIFLRELISNAVDATQKLKTLASVGEFKGELGDLTVRVELNKKKKTLTVSDAGIGMTDEMTQKIFLPFFTTKDITEGTGLGLAMVHGIVTAHGGKIVVESELGKGTRFLIHLPMTKPAQYDKSEV